MTENTVTAWTRLFDPDGRERRRYRSMERELDADGRRALEREFDPEGRVEKVRVFDVRGLLVEERVYDGDGGLDHRKAFTYDEHGAEREEAMWLGGERLHGRWVATHDEDGRVRERTWHDGEGVALVTERIEYDDVGRLVAKRRGNVAEWRYSYDSEGRVVAVEGGAFSDDEPEDRQLEYDAHGRLALETRRFATGELRSETRYDYGGEAPRSTGR